MCAKEEAPRYVRNSTNRTRKRVTQWRERREMNKRTRSKEQRRQRKGHCGDDSSRNELSETHQGQ